MGFMFSLRLEGVRNHKVVIIIIECSFYRLDSYLCSHSCFGIFCARKGLISGYWLDYYY